MRFCLCQVRNKKNIFYKRCHSQSPQQVNHLCTIKSSAFHFLFFSFALISTINTFLLHFLFHPFCHVLTGRIYQVLFFYHFRTFNRCFYPFCANKDYTSATNTKRHNLFPFQIIRFQKRSYNHWALPMSYWITYICQVWDKNFHCTKY